MKSIYLEKLDGHHVWQMREDAPSWELFHWVFFLRGDYWYFRAYFNSMRYMEYPVNSVNGLRVLNFNKEKSAQADSLVFIKNELVIVEYKTAAPKK